MKYFILISFLFLTLIVSAQTIVDEIAYVPSASGYYNNLIVKGNTNVNKLSTETFNVQSYGSVLTINVSANSRLYIGQLSVSNEDGSVYLREGEDHGLYFDPRLDEENNNILKMQGGGILSVNRIVKTKGSSGGLNVNEIKWGWDKSEEGRRLEINAHDIRSESNELNVKKLYIFGMEIPTCGENYYWQKVKVDNNYYGDGVLACDTSGKIPYNPSSPIGD